MKCIRAIAPQDGDYRKDDLGNPLDDYLIRFNKEERGEVYVPGCVELRGRIDRYEDLIKELRANIVRLEEECESWELNYGV